MGRLWTMMTLVGLLSGCDNEEVAWWDGCIDVLDAIGSNWREDASKACTVTSREVNVPTTLSAEELNACIDDVASGVCSNENVCGKEWSCSDACNDIRVFEALQAKDSAGYSQSDVLCG